MNPGREAGNDIWIAVILAMLLEFPLLFVHTRLLRITPGKDLYDIQQEAFGKVIGKITSFFFIWFAFHLGTLVLRNFSEFIEVISLQETPQYPILLIMGILCIWVVKSGIEVLGRWASFILPLFILVLFGIVFMSIPLIDLRNIRPVLYNGINPVLAGTASLFAFPFAEPALFTMIFDSLKAKDKILKVYMTAALLTAAVLITSYVKNILVLGSHNYLSLYFPTYFSVSLINISETLERIEALTGVTFLFGGFVKASVCLYIASKGFAKMINIDSYKKLVAPIGLLMICMANLIYSNTLEMFLWASEIYKYYVLPFYVILPLIILIAIKIKIRYKS
ncbi:GerAB/ArcD/ProY family transporter [Phosphitispora sp. TUW77]|uniref:GerAB/ArcD/ProY family transporter n=1 Tax=Phosphitispora sp. TUW77 TaxID=3152361 RepID=UPI003AB84881